MAGRIVGGVVCLGLAGLMLVANVGILSPRPDKPTPGVSEVIGMFLLPLVFVIVALKLFQRPRGGADKTRTQERIEGDSLTPG